MLEEETYDLIIYLMYVYGFMFITSLHYFYIMEDITRGSQGRSG